MIPTPPPPVTRNRCDKKSSTQTPKKNLTKDMERMGKLQKIS